MQERWRKFLAVLAGPDQPHAIFDAKAVMQRIAPSCSGLSY